MLKTKIKQIITLSALCYLVLIHTLYFGEIAINETIKYLSPMIPQAIAQEATVGQMSDKLSVLEGKTVNYAYNEQVPKEVVIAEIKKQAKEFGLGEQFMLDLAFNESGYNNLATNNNSTATGVYQYLWGTWKATESWKNKHIARTDYKANIREAMIDISNGEFSKWSESLD